MPYSKNPHLIDKELEHGLLLFDTDSGRMMELNSTAKLLWQKTKASFTADELRRIIEENCTSVKNLDSDIEDFIKSAKKHNLVSEDGKD